MRSTIAIDRLASLVAALGNEWRGRDEIIAEAGGYPDAPASARALFHRDLNCLRQLGFVVERTPERHNPAFRLAGHERLPAQIKVKFCASCAKKGREAWLPLAAFSNDASRPEHGRKNVTCMQCSRERSAAHYAVHPEMYGKPGDPERRRARQRLYYQRMRALGYRRDSRKGARGKWVPVGQRTRRPRKTRGA